MILYLGSEHQITHISELTDSIEEIYEQLDCKVKELMDLYIEIFRELEDCPDIAELNKDEVNLRVVFP